MSREMIEPWRQYGVKLEKEEMVDGVTHLFISVPTVSDFIDDNSANRNSDVDLFDLFFGQGRGNPFV